jgi:alkane 1-monooxygenase
MTTRYFKYATPFLIYLGAFISFYASGPVVWLPLIYSFVIIPLIELFIKADEKNLSAAEEEMIRKDPLFDWLLYLVVPLQYLSLASFLVHVAEPGQAWYDLAGKVGVMGLLCGVFGINVAHELGHRSRRHETTMAKMLLLTSLYMHFYIEHNKGHHKKVATREDPSSARRGEMVYSFYLRSIFLGYLSAWRIANREVARKGSVVFSLKNEMLIYQLVQLAFLSLIFFIFGGFVLAMFIAAAVIGILLLETVNYIEHYGLQRKHVAHGKYERALPEHSWNSNHIIGRVMLFELSRHSDHHYLASRKYQVLRHHDDSPQMPTGYPGMMLLSLVPPLWFSVMDQRVNDIERHA